MAKQKKANGFRMEIGLREGQEWSAEEFEKVKAFARDIDSKRTPLQRRRNEMAAIRFRMEQYINTEEDKITKEQTIEDFVGLYLIILRLNFKTFALAIDSNDANLKKYLKGERKFNEDLACRFGKFFHISPIVWMRVQHKNDLLRLSRVNVERHYRKYDFEKVVD
jgi:plasmid maintenance system antidote protein VapI